MQTIAVTGGAGFIGLHLCEALLDKGYDVICIDILKDKDKEENIDILKKNKNLTFYKTDIRDYEKLCEIFKKHSIDKIIHLAAEVGVRPSVDDPILYEEVNIKGTLNLLIIAKEFNIKNFVFASSSSVYGENKKVPFSEDDKTEMQLSPYAATKKAGELLCYTFHSLYKLNATCLRFFTVYGPRGRKDMAVYKFTHAIKNDKDITIYGSELSKRDYTYVGDLVYGIIAATEKDLPFEVINLGDSNPIELKYLIEIIEKQLNKKAKIKKMDPMPGDVPITFADISKAKELLGYQPKVKIEDGIRKFVDSM